MKIAIVRALGLGDLIVSLPALETVKLTYHNAQIYLLGSPWYKNFLNPRVKYIDHYITVPPTLGVRTDLPPVSNKVLSEFFDAMRQEKFDIALQLHGGGKYSNPFTKALGADLTVGLKSKDSVSLDRDIPYVVFQSEIKRYLEVVSLIGAKSNIYEPKIPVITNDEKNIEALLPKDDKPYIVLHPGAKDHKRRWPIEMYFEVAEQLMKHGYKLIVTGNKEEEELGQLMFQKLGSGIINICGKTSLSQMTGLLYRAKLLIANDTGPIHLARAVGTPTVTIIWGPNVIAWGPLSVSKDRLAISWMMSCPVCGQNFIKGKSDDALIDFCSHRFSLVKMIKPQVVIDLAYSILTEMR